MRRISDDQGYRRKKLITWGRWYFDKNKWTCSFCKRSQEFQQFHCNGIDYVATCPQKRVFRLNSNNSRFQSLLDRLLPGLFNGFGGIDYQAIEFIFNLFEIEPGQRAIAFDKVLAIASVIRELQDRDAKTS